MYRKWLTGLTMMAVSITAHSQDTISSKEVQRIITTLAADDMQGRKTFTPGIDKAASFIEQEFEKAGLQAWPGAKGFRQSFRMYRVKPVSVQLTINNEKRIPDNVVVQSSAGQLTWNQEGQVAEQHIKAGDNFYDRIQDLQRQKGNTIIWVDAAQSDAFRQYAQYLQNNYLQIADSTNLVLVLQQSTDTTIRSVNLEVRQQVTSLALNNVVGLIPGSSKPEEYVIFSAHYDHLGIVAPVAQDSIANGADDDASGTTAVITLANYYKQHKPARTLVFVAFTAEEIGGYGSRYFSKQLAPEKIVAMFNIEMIGKESKFGKNSAFITGYERSDFGQILQRNLEHSVFRFYPDPYPEQQLFYRSDNATLARLGVPAHTISTDQIDIDSLYHTVNDETESLDVENITNTIKAIAQSAVSIVDGKDTPTRVSSAALKPRSAGK